MMACPDSNDRVPQNDDNCPGGRAELDQADSSTKPTIFYGKFATFALFIGMVSSALGCVISLMGFVRSLVEFDPWALLQSAVGFFVLFALFVLFGRAIEWADRSTQ